MRGNINPFERTPRKLDSASDVGVVPGSNPLIAAPMADRPTYIVKAV